MWHVQPAPAAHVQTIAKAATNMCFLVHKENFSMEYFKLGIVRKVRPVELDREESRLINKFRTNIWGLNRIVVTR